MWWVSMFFSYLYQMVYFESEACLFGLSTVKYSYLNFQLDVFGEVKERNKTKQTLLSKVLSILDD